MLIDRVTDLFGPTSILLPYAVDNGKSQLPFVPFVPFVHKSYWSFQEKSSHDAQCRLQFV